MRIWHRRCHDTVDMHIREHAAEVHRIGVMHAAEVRRLHEQLATERDLTEMLQNLVRGMHHEVDGAHARAEAAERRVEEIRTRLPEDARYCSSPMTRASNSSTVPDQHPALTQCPLCRAIAAWQEARRG